MGMNAEQYASLLKNLMPRGLAFPRSVNTTLHKLCLAIADEMVRLDIRVGTDLINEADPRTANELLTDWERIVGLPEDGNDLASTAELRRNDVVRKLTFQGGQTPQFFIDLALLLGFTITITEFQEFKAGISKAGDAVWNETWPYAWQVNVDDEETVFFRAGKGVAGDPLAVFGTGALERILEKLKPAHTYLLFEYI